jgi:transposase-like protein
MYSAEKIREVLRVYRETGGELRETARRVGVSPSTVKTWYERYNEQGLSEDFSEEQELTHTLLLKARALLDTIDLQSSKEKQEVATAIEKLLNKYLELQGRQQKTLVIQQGLSDEEFKEALNNYFEEAAGEVIEEMAGDE